MEITEGSKSDCIPVLYDLLKSTGQLKFQEGGVEHTSLDRLLNRSNQVHGIVKKMDNDEKTGFIPSLCEGQYYVKKLISLI